MLVKAYSNTKRLNENVSKSFDFRGHLRRKIQESHQLQTANKQSEGSLAKLATSSMEGKQTGFKVPMSWRVQNGKVKYTYVFSSNDHRRVDLAPTEPSVAGGVLLSMDNTTQSSKQFELN